MRVIRFICAAVLMSSCGVTDPSSRPAVATPDTPAEQIPMTLLKPDGTGPFPAIVIMHDCSGLGPRSSGAPRRWADELRGQGYVVAIPDSFSTRGHAGGVCTDPSPSRNDVSPFRRVNDAYAALEYVRSFPYVDGRHVGLMGGSHGGATTLASMVAPERRTDPLAEAKQHGFAAAVALYPGCGLRLGDWRPVRVGSRVQYTGVYKPIAPLMILVGEKDDWTPAEPCKQLAEAAQKAGYPIRIKVYAGAHHSFDSSNPVRYVAERVNASSPTGRGATTGGDPAAWTDAIEEVRTFFSRYLGA